MTMIDTGTYGAKVQSWRRSSPRELLKRLIQEMPHADKPKLLSTFREELRKDDSEELFDAVTEYWFTNNYHSLVSPVQREAAVREAQIANIEKKVRQRIEEEARLVLLDMILPNGKALRQCTGKDCKIAGGWFVKIATKVKASQVVGKILSESQLRAMYRSSSKVV